MHRLVAAHWATTYESLDNIHFPFAVDALYVSSTLNSYLKCMPHHVASLYATNWRTLSLFSSVRMHHMTATPLLMFLLGGTLYPLLSIPGCMMTFLSFLALMLTNDHVTGENQVLGPPSHHSAEFVTSLHTLGCNYWLLNPNMSTLRYKGLHWSIVYRRSTSSTKPTIILPFPTIASLSLARYLLLPTCPTLAPYVITSLSMHNAPYLSLLGRL